MSGPTRRPAALLALAAVATLAGCRGERPPNVVVVVMDTTRGDRLAVNGYPRPTTPRLDEFAQDAVVFDNAWSPSGWTGPSHASLFTGLSPARHGFLEGNRPFLHKEASTIAELLKESGYATGCFTNNWVVSEEWGLIQGFDTYEPMFKHDRKATPARETHRRALAWAEEKHSAGEPFLLFINDIEAHLPYEPEDAFAERFIAADTTAEELAEARAFNHPYGVGYILGKVEIDDRRMQLLSDLYDAEIAALDHELGALIDGLRERSLLADTILVITGDHGEHLGEHGLMDHKFSLHRTLLHIPLIIRYPGHFDGGGRVSSPVRLEDVAATVLELTGVELPEKMDGVPLSRDLDGRRPRAYWGIWARFEEEMLSWFPGADTAPLYTSIRSIYNGRYHYIRDSDGREELYDVVADPTESNDLAATMTDVVASLRAELDDAR